MNEVTVVFQGMILWWMASTPAQVLIPDLSKMPMPHTATISAPLSAFASGSCPTGFAWIGSRCMLFLNGSGKPGGVQIALATNTPVAPAPQPLAANMCLVPKLQTPAGEQLALAPEFTPPDGSGNAAWMTATGGTGVSFMTSCRTAPDCPRNMQWKVAAAKDSNVVLVLKNLAGSPDVAALLNPGAMVTIANTPEVPFLADRAAARDRAAALRDDENHPSMMTPASAADWCYYFTMVNAKRKPNIAAPCPGKPAVPACASAGEAPAGAALSHKHPMGLMDFETIACSNSQYP